MKAIFLALAMISGTTWAADCNTNLPATAPDQRFDLHGDGTVTDLVTGLMWRVCPNDFTWNGSTCVGQTEIIELYEALQEADESTVGGYTDWRLPNYKELASLLELRCRKNPYNANAFFVDPDNSAGDVFGSSTIDAFGQIYRVDFSRIEIRSDGTVLERSVWRFVRDID